MAQPLALGIITSAFPSPQVSFERVKRLGLSTIQLGYPGGEFDSDTGIIEIQQACEDNGLEITTVFCGFNGESYADIPTVQATVGLVPPDTRADRVERTLEIARFANKLGVKRVAAHIGFVPEDQNDPTFTEVVAVLQRICDELAANGQVFALETGQETANGLKHFLEAVNRPNLRVNFDPANMILYGNDQPIPATETLFPWIDGVHCKDGKWPTEPQKLGHETPLGEGDVDLTRWLNKLLELGYRGTLTIEREISGDQQFLDVLKGKQLIESTLAAGQQQKN